MVLLPALALAIASAAASDVQPSGFAGPGRFCGQATVIDMVAGETIRSDGIGIHSGSLWWTGPFGILDVYEVSLALKPRGRVAGRTSAGATRFRERRERGRYVTAIWNGRQSAAYFSSRDPITPQQSAVIERVTLVDEGAERPSGCRFGTVFLWE